MIKTSLDEESAKLLYRLPENSPAWKSTLHLRTLRLSRLIELNAPDYLIKKELANMVVVVFEAVDVDVEYDQAI